MTAAAPKRPPAPEVDRIGAAEDTVGAAVAEAAGRLAACGVESPLLDARLLAGHALGAPPEAIHGYPERPMTAPALARFRALVDRRAGREPVSRILGRREFWSLSFAVTADTLDPRPDSEIVVAAALGACRRMLEAGADGVDGPLRILDLGTGTGCLLLALLHELPGARGLGIDLSPAVVAVARANAEALDLAGRAEFRTGHWGETLAGKFHCIVANPPYIPENEIPSLAPEVARFEPALALTGGKDGLDCYRDIAPYLPRLLAPRGTACIEVGAGQAASAAGIIAGHGLHIAGAERDLGGQDRCLIATHMGRR